MRTAKEYKKIALEGLQNNWGIAILVMLLVSIVEGALTATGVGSILMLVISGPIVVGLIIFFEKLINKQKVNLETIFEGLTTDFVPKMATFILQEIYILLWSLLFIIPGIIKSYSYAMSMYIMRKDGTKTSSEAITLSRQIMNGKKLKLFCLHLSFIGWFILSILTFGIGFIFLAPYIQASVTAFYVDAYADYFGNNDIENNKTNSEIELEPENKEIIIEE